MQPPVSSGTVYIKDRVDVWNKEQTIGNAELAARLGSPATFDRRGTVFWYDDFESSVLKWDTTFGTTGGGVGHSITVSDEKPQNGDGCVKVIVPDKQYDYAYMYRQIGGLAKNRIGLEVNFYKDITINAWITLFCRIYTGTRKIYAGIRLQQNELAYFSGSNPYAVADWTSFNTDHTIRYYTHYPMKFVIDVANEEYVRCMFGGDEIDMSAYSTPASADATTQDVQIELGVINNTNSNHSTHFDDFILTIEEPA